MREKLVGAVFVSSVLALSACGGGGDADPGEGGGGTGPCAGIERVCTLPEDCPSLQTCTSCGACVVDQGLRACEDTSDCPIGRACRVPEGATALACVRVVCEGHGDCLEGEACNAQRKACVPGDCVALGCPEGTVCREEDSACVECITNPDCAGTDRPYCAESTGTCVACEYDSDCPGRCVDHQCVACAENADCAAPSPICRDDGQCVGCLSAADCPGGVACLPEGRCDVGPIAGEACDPGRKCAPGHRCLGDGAGFCFLSCNPYAPVCADGEGCALIPDDEGRAVMEGSRPAGFCIRDDGGAGRDQSCDSSNLCQVGLVCLYDSATTQRCRVPCNPAASSTCGTGLSCEGVAIGAGGVDVGFCLPPSTLDDPCSRDEDCDPGQGCVLLVDDNDTLFHSCQYTEGVKTELQPCTTGTECRSGICRNDGEAGPGFCHGACATTADCGGGLCIHIGEEEETTGCVPVCDNDVDCSRYGAFVCGVAYDRVDFQLFGTCLARLGAGNAGDACSLDTECGSGWCETGAAAGFCVSVCEADTDCGGGLSCREKVFSVDASYDTIEVCWGDSCSRNADCPANWACSLEADPADPTGNIRFSCRPGEGTLPAGATCTADTDCLNGFCANVGALICYGPCQTSADCADGTYCEEQAFYDDTPDGTRHFLSACLPY